MAECEECGGRLRKGHRHEDPRDQRITELCLCTGCYRNALEELIDELQGQLDALPKPRKP